jgi:2-polyprenyl-6-methoxyphenol hydroxylase-like FAD-dependent oxidoreductase
VRIAVLGGGPGGLYLASLLRRADPPHEVVVFERNPPDATFGFGVVFPGRALGFLQASDPETFAALAPELVTLDSIEVRVRGRMLRCGGIGFSSVSRPRLLAILRRQADGVGAGLRFETEVAGLDDLAAYDLVVAADGVNSLTRAALARSFRPSVATGRARFIWFGSTKRYDALTFVFVQSEHGPFGVHAYPYEAGRSTFIVETDEASWRRAGFEDCARRATAPGESDLGSLAICERLFAEELGGERLLGNNSKWLRFPTVRNERWSHGNVVLLGDAAHTAHFSVGSGTRMAMEDASALAGALARHDDLGTALAAYEEVRRPEVERIQAAAAPSQDWWERFGCRLHLDPEQLAFHFLTRTPAFSRETLRARDAGFVDAVEAWFGGGEPLASPFSLRGRLLPSRVVSGPESDALACVRVTTPPDDPAALAEELRRRGCDLVGAAGPARALVADRMRIEAGMPTLVDAASRDEANTLILAGRADLCRGPWAEG